MEGARARRGGPSNKALHDFATRSFAIVSIGAGAAADTVTDPFELLTVASN
jgi:hypothetical protein